MFSLEAVGKGVRTVFGACDGAEERRQEGGSLGAALSVPAGLF